MRDESISIQIDGDDAGSGRGSKREPTLKELQASAEREAANAAYWQQERARAFRERDFAVQQNLAVRAGALQTEQEAAEAQLREAHEYHDTDKFIEAQRALTDIATRRQQLEYAQARAAQPSRPADPVEAYCQGRSERSASWLRSHPEFVVDPRKNAKLNAAHSDAIAEGHAPDTDGYMAHVERFVGVRGNGDDAQSPRARVQSSQSQTQTIRMSREDYERARETAASLTDRNGKPMSVERYLQLKHQMAADPVWRRVDDLGRTV
jgi:hypothetical protein